jgi:hypothetical protein
LFGVVNALLTTRGCGCPPDRPQQMGINEKPVNRFVVFYKGFFSEKILEIPQE